MATNATIVERLNELIDIKKGEEHGTTISQCLGILNKIESTPADDGGQSLDNEEVQTLSEPETVADDEE